MNRFPLFLQILLAFVLAIIFGIFFKDYINYVSWMGDIFMRGLKMIVIPLILSSIVSGVANIGSSNNLGRLGLKTMAYYLTTSTVALLTGLVLVNTFKPGVGVNIDTTSNIENISSTTNSFKDTLINIVPTNIIEAMADNKMLSIIFFAIILGFFITRTSEKHKVILTDFFNALFDVMMKITMFVIKFTPFGVFGIVSVQMAENSNLIELISRLGLFIVVVLLALFIHAFIWLPLMTLIIGKVNPIKHLKAMRTPLITAFSTASSNSTLPLTMDAVENKSGVSNSVTSFTLPLGATINMDGTALYELIVVMFIAQAYGIEMTFTQQIVIVLTGLLTSIGAAGIPMASLVMISVILTAVGLPLEGIGLIIAVDRLIDMFRTAVNVWSDSCGAVIIAKSEKETLNY